MNTEINCQSCDYHKEVEDLSKRVAALEKQIVEDKEEKLKAELNYAKFSCALPTILNMMSDN